MCSKKLNQNFSTLVVSPLCLRHILRLNKKRFTHIKSIDMKRDLGLFLMLFTFISSLGFSQDGTLDTSFGDNGIVTTDFNEYADFGYSIAQQGDGKLVVVGASAQASPGWLPFVLRFLENGDLDTSFGVDGKVFADYGENLNRYTGVYLQSNGKIIVRGVIGPSSDRDLIIVRYLPTGEQDTTFATNGILTISNQDWIISDMIVLDDDSMLLTGLTDNDTTITFAHYMPDGTLDLSYGINGYATSANPNGFFNLKELKILENNEPIIFGTRDLGNSTQTLLIKFLSDGYLDTAFGNIGSAIKSFDPFTNNDYIRAGFDITDEGKIVIGGGYGDCLDISDPLYQSFLLRYLSTGEPDPAFGNNGVALLSTGSFLIYDVFHQANGRLLVQGIVPECFEGSFYKLRRYYSDGYLDTSFDDSNILEFYDFDTIIQENGKIVGVGSTWWYNGFENVVLVRYNNNVLDVNAFSSYNFRLFPNPSEGIFNLTHTLTEFENIPYQVSDISGKIIQEGIVKDELTTINLSHVQSGMYFLKALYYTTRLIKN